MSDFKDLHKFFGQQQQQQQQQHEHHQPLAPPQQHHRAGDPSPFTGPNPGSLSNLFSEPFPENEFRSFSDLLAGAIANQLPGSGELNLGLENWGSSDNRGEKRGNGGNGGGYKDNRPGSLVLPPATPVFNVSPGFSPSAFLNSPTFLSPLGITPQQTLAHLTAQAALSQAQLNIQQADHTTHHNNPASSAIASSATHPYQSSIFSAASQHTRAPPPPPQHSFPAAVDKPADDGYNWRKYGQKQVKGSEYPRSYYRCTTPNCPVKKKVERSFDGHITEIIYKGQHNHERPQTGRRAKDSSNFLGGDWRDYDNNNNNNTAQATSIQLNGPSDNEESDENSENIEGDDDERQAKRRNNGGGGKGEGGFTHRTMTEPKIVVQTRSDVDLLDDGYRWRKYGQKVVKGNPNPRSYYKCTTVGCKVRKHVERASTDSGAVITTYEGKHNHDVPATRGSSISNNAANCNDASSMKVKTEQYPVNVIAWRE